MSIKTIPLHELANYSDTRVFCASLSSSSYVGTDNILQNKQGKIESDFVPRLGYTVEYIAGDTLIANIRPYLRKIWYATNNGGSSPDVLTIHPSEKIVSKFLYYALFQDRFFEYAMKGSKGTKMPRGDKKQVMDFPIPNFPREAQKNIADILSALDDKIEMNNRINPRLENIAKTLYNYWFIQFDFPDENKRPLSATSFQSVFHG
jgi:type I restriction enzyme S subunit